MALHRIGVGGVDTHVDALLPRALQRIAHLQRHLADVLRHNYNTDDMEHRVPELVEWATTVMTMNSGDLIACGTNHEGLGFLQDGETCDIEVQHVGKMTLKVRDPLKRTWEKGVYMGVDSTNPDAVKRHRPQGGPAATGAI